MSSNHTVSRCDDRSIDFKLQSIKQVLYSVNLAINLNESTAMSTCAIFNR